MAEVVHQSRKIEAVSWKWMRYSGLLLIPLAWGHVLVQDVLVGVHSIDLDYVALRWATFGWRLYDFLLLAFAFAHGMNGLRQVFQDFIKDPVWMRRLTWGVIAIWLLLSSIGAIAILGGVRQP